MNHRNALEAILALCSENETSTDLVRKIEVLAEAALNEPRTKMPLEKIQPNTCLWDVLLGVRDFRFYIQDAITYIEHHLTPNNNQ